MAEKWGFYYMSKQEGTWIDFIECQIKNPGMFNWGMENPNKSIIILREAKKLGQLSDLLNVAKVPCLKNIAKVVGLTGYSSMRRNELIRAIEDSPIYVPRDNFPKKADADIIMARKTAPALSEEELNRGNVVFDQDQIMAQKPIATNLVNFTPDSESNNDELFEEYPEDWATRLNREQQDGLNILTTEDEVVDLNNLGAEFNPFVAEPAEEEPAALTVPGTAPPPEQHHQPAVSIDEIAKAVAAQTSDIIPPEPISRGNTAGANEIQENNEEISQIRNVLKNTNPYSIALVLSIGFLIAGNRAIRQIAYEFGAGNLIAGIANINWFAWAAASLGITGLPWSIYQLNKATPEEEPHKLSKRK